MNGDGHVDVMTPNAIYFGNGIGVDQNPIARSYASTQLGDYNGDGVFDGYGVSGDGKLEIALALTERTSAIQRLNLTNRIEALNSLSIIDQAFSRVSSELGEIGSTQSRLAAAVEHLRSSTESLAAAEARITDIDVAEKSAQLLRSTLAQWAASAILGQANQAPELALILLGASRADQRK